MSDLLLFARRGRPTIDWSFLGSIPSGFVYTNTSANRTYTDADGLMKYAAANEPRFDHDPVTHEPRGLLLEGQAQNLCRVSDALGSWTNLNNSSVTSNAALDPTGATNADVITATANGNCRVQNIINLESGTLVTFSGYLKAGTVSGAALQFHNGAAGNVAGTIYNLTGAGSVVNNTGGATSTIRHIGNGLYYCTTTFTTGFTNGYFIVGPATNASGFLQSSIGNSISGWGLQVETGSMATSYIPTTTAAVTRLADRLTTTNIPWFNPNEGTFVVEAVYAGFVTVKRYPTAVSFNSNEAQNEISLRIVSATASEAIIKTDATPQAQISLTNHVVGSLYKHAISYSTSLTNTAANGVSGTPDTSATIPTITRLALGRQDDSSPAKYIFGHIRSFSYYNRCLSTRELQRITT